MSAASVPLPMALAVAVPVLALPVVPSVRLAMVATVLTMRPSAALLMPVRSPPWPLPATATRKALVAPSLIGGHHNLHAPVRVHHALRLLVCVGPAFPGTAAPPGLVREILRHGLGHRLFQRS